MTKKRLFDVIWTGRFWPLQLDIVRLIRFSINFTVISGFISGKKSAPKMAFREKYGKRCKNPYIIEL